MTLYETLADTLQTRIEQGFYVAGARLPSIRALSQEHGVSISTAQQALLLLEQRQWVEVRPKSGFYVKARQVSVPIPHLSRTAQYPLQVSQWEEVLALLCDDTEGFIKLSRGMSDIDTPTLKPLMRILADLTRSDSARCLSYEPLHGSLELREQIARLSVDSGSVIHPDEIITTTGCQEALSIAIQAVTEPGDVVAVESPGFYGLMQILKARDLKALEIPMDATHGLSLDALELALDQWPIKAILVIPTYHNPLGSCMPDANKQRLLKLAQRYNVPIIEDDIYGSLGYRQPRPRTVHSFDTEGRVILCSSFSKTLASGLRVGWLVPGRYRERVAHLKYVGTAAAVTLTQLAIAEFIKQGFYDRHLRKMRQQYQAGRDTAIALIREHFPAGTRVSFPLGGYMLWIELPEACDVLDLAKQLLLHKIQIAPGVIFSASGKYRHCLRMNVSHGHEPAIQAAIVQVGQVAKRMLASLEVAEPPEAWSLAS
ncbi:PLP-dependent aminotransferase family protein [Thiolinea disciformis]|uniref:aminotransferase-like domain-containing protein n=1 Tax=Thiolinea disciformis TaxID=125614 RepID=UPI000379CB7C|nr:PLP-dependent aminotransferase family protein [Thiolinea disciformis]